MIAALVAVAVSIGGAAVADSRPSWIGNCTAWGNGYRYYGADCNTGNSPYLSSALCSKTIWPGGSHYDYGTYVYPPNSSPGACNSYEIASQVHWTQ